MTAKEVTATATLGSAFARIGVSATPTAAGDTLGVRLVQATAATDHAFYADLVTMRTATRLMGDSTAGTVWTGMSINAKRVSRFGFTSPGTVDISHLRAYADGKAATSGTQPVRGLIYADASGAPGALVGRTYEVIIAAGRAPGWITLKFAAPVRIKAGTYWLGLHSGGTVAVGRFASATATNALRRNNDPYADGATNPFSSPISDNLQLSMQAVGG